MCKRTIQLIALAFVFIFSNAYSGQTDYEKAWEELFNNNEKEAAKLFLKAAEDKSGPDSKFGWLMLAMIENQVETEKFAGFNYFQNFIKEEKNPEPYIFALWPTMAVNSGYNAKDERQLDFLNSILESNKYSGTLKAMAAEMIAKHYDQKMEWDDADEYYSMMGAIMDWSFAGEFENISASGFDKNYPPVFKPENDNVFTNKYGAEVSWFSCDKTRTGEWIRFTKHFYFHNAIIYAQTFVNSPKEQTAFIRVGTSGSLKIFVNDSLALSESEERNNNLDTYITEVTLSKGFNRLLLQIGESEAGDSNFMCRITDKEGNPINGLSVQPVYSKSGTAYKPYKGIKPVVHQLDPEKYFEDMLEKYPGNPVFTLMLSETYLLNDKVQKARMVFEKLAEKHPDCVFLLVKEVTVLLRDDNRTELSRKVEKIRDIDPNQPFALTVNFQEAMDNKEYEEAAEYLKSLEDYYDKEIADVYNFRIQLASARQETQKMIELIQEAYAKYPENQAFVNMMFMVQNRVFQDKSKAVDILEDYLDEHFSVSMLKTRAGFYLNDGDMQDAFDLLEVLVESEPDNDSHLNYIGELYYDLGKYAKAREYFSKCIEIAPYVGSYHADMAKTYEQENFVGDAVKLYEKCIYYSPTDYDVRAKIRELKGNRPIFEFFDEPDLYALFENAPEQDKYPEDNSLILLDEVQRVVYGRGASEEKHYMAVKIFNASGIDAWKEMYVPYSNQRYNIEKAEVIKKDGSKIKAEISGSHVVFTTLEEGDGIIIIYKLQDSRHVGLEGNFWDKHYFSMYVPYLKSKYSLLINPDIEFEHRVINSEMKPEITDVNSFKMYVWEKLDQPSIKYETLMPGLGDVGEILHISSIPDWDYVSKWYSRLAKTKAKSDIEVRELVRELFDGKDNLKESEIVRMIYDYIVKNIRYSYVSFRQSGMIPQKASKTINTKIGDCKDVSTLFVAMCSEMDVNSQLVLVDTRDNGKLDMALPSIDFDHCIAAVNVDGSDYYVELTNDYNPFSTVYYGLMEAFSLKIDDNENIENKPVYINPPTRVKNTVQRWSEISFIDDKMIIEKKNVKTGGNASIMRSGYRDEGEEQRMKDMQEAVSDEFPSLKVTRLEFDDNLYTTGDTLSYRYAYEVYNPMTNIAGLSLFKIPLSDGLKPADFLPLMDRKFPLDIWPVSGVDNETEYLTINIPEGMIIAELPENTILQGPGASYKMEFKLNGNKLEIIRKIEYKTDEIPADKYNAFKDFYGSALTSDTRQIALKKK